MEPPVSGKGGVASIVDNNVLFHAQVAENNTLFRHRRCDVPASHGVAPTGKKY
jgi:hypothetical protein